MEAPRPPRPANRQYEVARLILRYIDLNAKLPNMLKERNHKIFLIRKQRTKAGREGERERGISHRLLRDQLALGEVVLMKRDSGLKKFLRRV